MQNIFMDCCLKTCAKSVTDSNFEHDVIEICHPGSLPYIYRVTSHPIISETSNICLVTQDIDNDSKVKGICRFFSVHSMNKGTTRRSTAPTVQSNKGVCPR